MLQDMDFIPNRVRGAAQHHTLPVVVLGWGTLSRRADRCVGWTEESETLWHKAEKMCRELVLDSKRKGGIKNG